MISPEPQTKTKTVSKEAGPLGEIIRFAFITLIIVIPIRAYVAQPFIVSGTSMVPTFNHGQYLIIDELSYYFRPPRRGEVVVFRFPQNPAKFFIKRIIGLPGETVIINGHDVAIAKDDSVKIINEPYVEESQPYQTTRIKLKEKEYFVMGDNRDVSSDSRIWGPVTDNLIKGRALVRLLPVTEFAIRPGDASQEFNQL